MDRLYLKLSIVNTIALLSEIYGSTFSMNYIIENEKEIFGYINSVESELKEIIKSINDILAEAKGRKVEKKKD